MPVKWSEGIRGKANVLLAKLHSGATETPLQVLQDLRQAGFSLRVEGDTLFVKPRPEDELTDKPAQWLNDCDTARIRAHKFLMMALLRPMPPLTCPETWEDEWRHEADMIYRRQAAAATPRARKLLAEVAGVHPRSEEQWLELGGRIRAIEEELRAVNELPPVSYHDGKS